MSTNRAAVYTRLSKATQQSTSIDRQREDAETLIQEGGWTYSPQRDYYEDNDRSAYDRDVVREGFDRLRDHLDRYDVVVYWKGDRVFRDTLEFAAFLRDCRDAGVRPVSVQEGEIDLDDPMSILAKGMFPGAQAEQESRNTSQRIRSAQEYNRKHGWWHGGRYPYGYEGVRVQQDGHEGTKLRAVQEKAEVIRDVAERVLSGEGLNTVVRDLNERGVPSPGRTDDWTYPGTKLLLENPTTAGWVATSNGADDGKRRIVYRDGEPVSIVLGNPVLDPDTWRRLQAMFDRSRGSRPSRPNRSLLAGLIRCRECGYAMRADNRDKHPVYRCISKYERGAEVCPGNVCSMSGVNSFVLGAAEGLVAQVYERGADAHTEAQSDDLGPLHSKLAHLKNLEAQQEDELDRLLHDEGRDYEDAAVERHQERMARTRNMRDEITAEIEAIRDGEHVRELRERLGSEPVDTFTSLDTDDKRHVLTLLLDRVEVSKADGLSAQAPTFDTDRVKITPR